MEGKVLCILTLAVYSSAASIGGFVSLGPFQGFANGGVSFRPPSLPFYSTTNSSNAFNNSSINSTNSAFGPFVPFLNAIPGLGSLASAGGLLNGTSPFPNIEELISRISGIRSNRNGTNGGNTTVVVPFFPPTIGFGQASYIPGLSEALAEARKHLIAALNITSDFSSGIREAVQIALDSDHPVDSIRVILNTIAKVYSTVAANCPIIIVGQQVFAEGVRLAQEVARSVGNVMQGTNSTTLTS